MNVRRSIATAVFGFMGALIAGQGEAASDSPVVFCHDPERNLVTTTMIGDCRGNVVSAEEAAETKDSRRRRIMDAMAPEPLDEVVEDNGVTILIDAKAVLFLLGSEVDYEVTPLHEKFVFRNPNQTDACGCGESVTIIPATV